MRWKSRRGAGAAHRHEARGADTRSLAAVGALERGDPPSPRHGGSNPDPGENILAGGAQLAGGNEADSRATGPSGTAADSEITTCKAERVVDDVELADSAVGVHGLRGRGLYAVLAGEVVKSTSKACR